MMSGFVFPENDRPVFRDAFAGVAGEPGIFALGEVLKAFDLAQRGHDLGYGCPMRRGGGTNFAAALGRRYRASFVGLIRKCRSHVLSYSLRESPSYTPLFRGVLRPSRFSAQQRSKTLRHHSSSSLDCIFDTPIRGEIPPHNGGRLLADQSIKEALRASQAETFHLYSAQQVSCGKTRQKRLICIHQK